MAPGAPHLAARPLSSLQVGAAIAAEAVDRMAMKARTSSRMVRTIFLGASPINHASQGLTPGRGGKLRRLVLAPSVCGSLRFTAKRQWVALTPAAGALDTG